MHSSIQAHFPDLREPTEGRDTLLAFNDDVGKVLRKILSEECDDNGVHLAKAAEIVRKEMLKIRAAFNGSFTAQCQKESVPESLLSLVQMILHGPSITKQSQNFSQGQSALSIAQILLYNSQSQRSSAQNTLYHSRDRETPLPIYLGLKVHALTRKQDLVDTLFQLGITVSYKSAGSNNTIGNNAYCL
jgi:hypothetical protein